MKSIKYVPLILLLICGLSINAQQILSTYSAAQFIYKGDSVSLEVNDFYGNIQWQKSSDLNNWENINGATSGKMVFIADTAAYYRAAFVAGICDTIYSDTIDIQALGKLNIIFDLEINEAKVYDSVTYGSIMHPLYHINIKNLGNQNIEPGSIILDSTGSGTFYMVTRPISGLKSTQTTNSNLWEAFKPSLDFLFNYESSIIEFSTRENRAKLNSTIDGKLSLSQIEDDNRRFVFDDLKAINGWEGYHLTRNKSLIDIGFEDVKFSLNAKNLRDDGTRASLNVEINGYLKIDPAIDFRMVYNPEYLSVKNESFMDYMKTVANIVDPALFFGNAALTLGTLKQLKAITYTNLDYGMQVKLFLEGKAEKENHLFEVRIAKYTQVYPIGVVIMSMQTEVIISIDLSIAGKLEAEYHFQNQNDIVLGFDLLKAGLFENDVTWYREVNSISNSGGALVAEIELEAGIKLIIRHEHYVAGILGPKLEGTGYVKGKIEFWTSTQTPDPSWEITVDAGLKGKALFDLSMFHYNKLTWKIFESNEIKFAEYNIYTCPDKLKISDGNNQVGNPGIPLTKPVKVEVLDSKGNSLPSLLPNVPVYFGGNDLQGYNGIVTKSPAYTSNGFAETNWTLDAEPQEQKLLVALRDAYGGIIGDPVEFNATVAEEGTAPVAAFTASPTSGTAPLTVNFTDQSANSPTGWSWDFGDGTTSTQQNTSKTYSNPGTYKVSLTVTNSHGSNAATKTNYITVNAAGSEPIANFTATPTNITTGQSVQFTDQSTNVPTSQIWNFGDGGSSTEQNPSHTYLSSGTYTVSLTVTNNYGSDTETKTDLINVTESGCLGCETGTITDYEGNVYNTVKIGNQWWMAENLKATKYSDGSDIPNVTDATAWLQLSTPAYCWYNNNEAIYKNPYGALYNWYTVSPRNYDKNVCPTGWHVPSDREWIILTDYLTNNGYGYGLSGSDIAKSMAATSGWATFTVEGTVGNDQVSNNSSGFTALPSGYRDNYGAFLNIGKYVYWWTSTEGSTKAAWSRSLSYNSQFTRYIHYYDDEYIGYSVRCLRD